MRRLASALAGALLVLLLVAVPARALQTPEPPLRNADYFAFADGVTEQLENSWSERKGYYTTGARSIDTIANAAMLTVFATSAAYGHVGPARNDERARMIAERLTAAPPYWTAVRPPRYDKMFHTPGWTSNMDGPYVDMDKSIDPKVAEGLQIAYRVRDQLGLPPETVAAIKTEIAAVSHVDFFRYPKVRLNQINWNAELYAYDYLVNGDPTLLRKDYREHVHAFTQGFKTPQIKPNGSPNVGPSYRFTYQSNAPMDLARNVDSAEYAMMTLHFLYWYDTAEQAGMTPLPAEDKRLLRGWVQRSLYGYWTHAGFMNWDTGWSYERWMKGKAWAYGMQGLLAIATSPDFRRRKAEGAYAKYLFDRGLRLFEHLGEERGGKPFRPSAQLFGIGEQGAPATKMFWARMAANATRAVSAGMGTMDAKKPPPFYAYDADIGRLAVSTPSYSTAILAVDRNKVPYGGQDLARLYDADGDPLTGTGAKGEQALGAIVRTTGGTRLLTTAAGLGRDPKTPPLTLTRSPLGRVTKQKRLATQPDAGPFGRLAVVGSRVRGGIKATSAYDFHSASIDARWRFARKDLPELKAKTRKARAKARRKRVPARAVTIQLPVSGRQGVIGALLKSGAGVALTPGGPSVQLADVKTFYLRGSFGSYRVEVPADGVGTTRVLKPRYQRPNPRGGPTLQLRLPLLRRAPMRFGVRIVPMASGGVGEPTPEEIEADPTPTPVPEASATPGP